MDKDRTSIIVVMGATAAGKTTVGARLAHALGWSFLDGDRLHPAANIAKMRRGVALSDADRAPWLERLRAEIEAYLRKGERAVVACSALRRAYRVRLRVDPAVRFVYLRGTEPMLRARLRRRRGHFAGEALLASQLTTLEEPRDALVLDAALPVEELVARIIAEYEGLRTED